MLIFSDFADGEAHCRAQFFQMFANFVRGDAALLCGMPAQFQGGLDLLAKNSLEPVRQRLAQFQTEAHIMFLLVGQSDVAITFFTSHFPVKPRRWFEFVAGYVVGKFHFCDYETGMFTAININLDE